MHGRKWTTDEDELLADLYGRVPSEEIRVRLRRSRSSLQNRARFLGIARRSNIGMHPNCRAHWFRKGQVRGISARRWRSLRTVSVRRDKGGKRRRWIKIREGGPTQYRYVPLARYLWEFQHGPIPKGAFVFHLDGDMMNDDIGNLACITRRELPAYQQRANPRIKGRIRAALSQATSDRWSLYRFRKEQEKARVCHCS